MTAEERKILEDNLPKEFIDEWGGTITKLMRLHTLTLIEQAVDKCIWNHSHVISTCDNILNSVRHKIKEAL